MKPLYDRIGPSYDQTRAPDPGIVATLVRAIKPRQDGRYLDVACGTGNYTIALGGCGLNLTGVDASAKMLAAAQVKSPSSNWVEGLAQELPFEDGAFDGAMCTLAIHHFQDLNGAFSEIIRVISRGCFVIFTAGKAQMGNYWLSHYFPQMMRQSIEQMPEVADVKQVLVSVGFENIKSMPWSIPKRPIDHFLYCGKHQPELYLESHIRSGISSFQNPDFQEEIDKGLFSLRSDLNSGAHQAITERYSSDLGDYTFIVCEKLA